VYTLSLHDALPISHDACWYRYVDDTFVIWPHGKEKLTDFLNHPNGIHSNIQFTMEIEGEGHLPFLDKDIHSKMDGSLGHKVYRKLAHTNLYLHQKSITIKPTNTQSSHTWYTEQRLYPIRNPLHLN
jgi:hypothetical protein